MNSRKLPLLCTVASLLAAPLIHADTLIEIRFDDAESDGLTYVDTSENGRHLKLNGPSEQSEDLPFSEAEAGDGNRSFLNPGGTLGGFGGDILNATTLRLDTHQAFTIEGWVKWHSGAGGLCRITGTHLMIWLAWDAAGEIYLTHGESTIIRTGVRIPQDTWVHLAYTFGDGQFTLYLDGKEQMTGEASAADIAALGSEIKTIHLFEADGVLNGGADDFRLSDQALKPEELGVHRPLGRSLR